MPLTFTAHVITCSDRAHQGIYEDKSGEASASWLTSHGYIAVDRTLVPDDASKLIAALDPLVAKDIKLVVITGGTGLGSRDITPQTLDGWADYSIPGFGELLRAESRRYSLNAYLSRCGGWVKKSALVLALPGNPKAAVEQLDILADLLPHALKSMQGLCDHRRKVVD